MNTGTSIRTVLSLWAVITLLAGPARALTIYDVQHCDAADGWKSPYVDQVVDVTGGVVTYVGRPPGKATTRVVIQDPSFTEWAGIEVKIYLLFDATNYGSDFSVVQTGVVVAPTIVPAWMLGNGEQSAAPEQAERYEGMLLAVQDVTIGSLGLGSHNDNYELVTAAGTCWATDYFNLDRDPFELYHALTQPGSSFDAVVGILEQYTKTSDQYDYYQLMTRNSADFVPEPATSALFWAATAMLLGHRRHTKPAELHSR